MRRDKLGGLRTPIGCYGKHSRAECGPLGGVDPQPDTAPSPGDPVEESLSHSGLPAAAHSMENVDSPALVLDSFRQPVHQAGAVPEDPRGTAYERSAYGIRGGPVKSLTGLRPHHHSLHGRPEEG
ncbi:hypothetical protein GCM10010518_43080 [Kitasatospora cinereorecta]